MLLPPARNPQMDTGCVHGLEQEVPSGLPKAPGHTLWPGVFVTTLLFNYYPRLETKGVGQEYFFRIRVADDRDIAVRVGDNGYGIRIPKGIPGVQLDLPIDFVVELAPVANPEIAIYFLRAEKRSSYIWNENSVGVRNKRIARGYAILIAKASTRLKTFQRSSFIEGVGSDQVAPPLAQFLVEGAIFGQGSRQWSGCPQIKETLER